MDPSIAQSPKAVPPIPLRDDRDAIDERDEALEHLAQRTLKASGYYAVSRLRCEAAGGVVIISGVLPSYFLKQIAQTAILKLQPVCRIEDHIEVIPDVR